MADIQEVYPFGDEPPRKLPEVNNPVNKGPFGGSRMRTDPVVKAPVHQNTTVDIFESVKDLKAKSETSWINFKDTTSAGLAIAFSIALLAQAVLQGLSLVARSIRESK